MKRIAFGAIGIAAIAALAVPSAVRPASAATTSICTVNTSPCPSGNLYGTNVNTLDTLSGSLASASAKLSTSLGTITCTNSAYSASSHADGTSGSESGLVFNDGSSTQPCTTNLLGNPTATITVNNEPYSASAVKTSGTNWDGTLTVNSVNVTIKLSNGLTCTATVSAATGNLYNKGNANAPVGGANASHSEVDIPGISVSISGSFCPTSGTETVTYYMVGTNPANTDIYITT
jgi:hypothetical protein